MKTNLHEWINQSSSAFDVLVCKSTQLPSDFKILNPAAIDHECQNAFPDKVGAFPLHKATSGLQHIAHRVVRRIAQLNTQQVDVTVNGLQNAWFHPVYAELATLIPIRHLARRLATQSPVQPYAILLASRSFTALNSWSKNDLEPLYLAYELRRRKVPVVLFIEGEGTPNFQFKLSKTWLPKGYPQIRRNKKFTTVMCKRAMRRATFVSEKSTAKQQHKPRFFSIQRHFGIDRNPRDLTLNLRDGPSFGDIQSFSAPSDTPLLDHGFVQLMGPLTQKVTQWYRHEFKSRLINEAHIADHASFEGGLLAAEVTRRNGQVYLWPHSANLVHMHAHDPRNVARVTVAAQSTGTHWAKKFHNQKVAIDFRSILPETASAPLFDKELPLQVILFAGAHALKRTPLLDNEGHRATWTRVLRDLHDSGVELTIKHKSSWETREWIKGLAPEGAKLRFSRTHANKLNLPNMIFLSISLTSTAILEGIARGIPGMTVRDVPIDETPYYAPDFVPCLPSDKAADFISNLNSKAAFDNLREKQQIWFERETSPNHAIAAPKY